MEGPRPIRSIGINKDEARKRCFEQNEPNGIAWPRTVATQSIGNFYGVILLRPLADVSCIYAQNYK